MDRLSLIGARSQDVCLMMAKKIGFTNPEDDCLLFSLNEARDGSTSECITVPSLWRGGRAVGSDRSVDDAQSAAQ
jgi:hypothetical protein